MKGREAGSTVAPADTAAQTGRSPVAQALIDGGRTLSRLALGLAALVLLQTVGAVIARAVGLPVPGAVIGMVLLLGVLLAGRPACLRRSVESASAPLLGHMMLFFIPAVAGIVDQGAALSTGWLPFLAACVIGAALTLAATGLTLKCLLARRSPSR